MPEQDRFQPVPSFSWDINRAERSYQARWLVPLLDRAEGRIWFLDQLASPCVQGEARAARVFHLCFPLKDIFSDDFDRCRGKPQLEDEFIAYYNQLFDLPPSFGVHEVWRTAPDDQIRHPAAGGKAGWYEAFLKERIPDREFYNKARNARRMLGTEADVLLLTSRHVVLVECKYRGEVSTEQYERHLMMGSTFARRLDRDFYFGMVVRNKRDVRFAHIKVPYVLWSEIEAFLKESAL